MTRHCPAIYSPAPEVRVTAGRIGPAIHTLRKYHDLTQVQLRERIGISRCTIVEVGRGEVGTAAGICPSGLDELGLLDDSEAIRNAHDGPDAPEAPGRI